MNEFNVQDLVGETVAGWTQVDVPMGSKIQAGDIVVLKPKTDPVWTGQQGEVPYFPYEFDPLQGKPLVVKGISNVTGRVEVDHFNGLGSSFISPEGVTKVNATRHGDGAVIWPAETKVKAGDWVELRLPGDPIWERWPSFMQNNCSGQKPLAFQVDKVVEVAERTYWAKGHENIWDCGIPLDLVRKQDAWMADPMKEKDDDVVPANLTYEFAEVLHPADENHQRWMREKMLRSMPEGYREKPVVKRKVDTCACCHGRGLVALACIPGWDHDHYVAARMLTMTPEDEEPETFCPECQPADHAILHAKIEALVKVLKA